LAPLLEIFAAPVNATVEVKQEQGEQRFEMLVPESVAIARLSEKAAYDD
jgi:hypothetical protein